MILTKEEARKIMKKALSFSSADACEVNLDGTTSGNIRYARNTVSTAGVTQNLELVISSNFGKKSGVSTTNDLTDAGIKKAVKRSEELAKLSPENPEFMEILGPQKHLESKAFSQNTANISPSDRTLVAVNSIMQAKKRKMIAAGFMEDESAFYALMNSKGLFAYEQESQVDFTLTVRSEDGTGSGWVTRDVNDFSKMDTAEASRIAVEKAAKSRKAKALEPGKYTVILEPAASIGLLRTMMWNMGQRRADEGRSFMSKEGGGVRIGEKMVDERITMYSDPLDTEVPASTWNGDGRPQKKRNWIENGVFKNLHCGRFWANKKKIESIPYPSNMIYKGGDKSLEELIKGTKKGILVTRLWYIRSVDPQTLLYTGLTRDGTFLIENGKISYPVKNFRFNESPIIMLNNLEELGQCQRVDGNMIPALKIRDFTFSSLSDAI